MKAAAPKSILFCVIAMLFASLAIAQNEDSYLDKKNELNPKTLEVLRSAGPEISPVLAWKLYMALQPSVQALEDLVEDLTVSMVYREFAAVELLRLKPQEVPKRVYVEIAVCISGYRAEALERLKPHLHDSDVIFDLLRNHDITNHKCELDNKLKEDVLKTAWPINKGSIRFLGVVLRYAPTKNWRVKAATEYVELLQVTKDALDNYGSYSLGDVVESEEFERRLRDQAWEKLKEAYALGYYSGMFMVVVSKAKPYQAYAAAILALSDASQIELETFMKLPQK